MTAESGSHRKTQIRTMSVGVPGLVLYSSSTVFLTEEVDKDKGFGVNERKGRW